MNSYKNLVGNVSGEPTSGIKWVAGRKQCKATLGILPSVFNFLMLFVCKLTGQAMFEPTCSSMSLVVRRNRMRWQLAILISVNFWRGFTSTHCKDTWNITFNPHIMEQTSPSQKTNI